MSKIKLNIEKSINYGVLQLIATSTSADYKQCIIWEKAKSKAGYGVFSFKNILYYAHRIILEIKLNRNLKPKYLACHKCDNPSCINPNHLFEGNRKDNSKDMVIKNRQARGENHSQTKLTNDKVLHIKKLQKDGLKPFEVAKIYNLNHEVVRRIFTEQNWGWLTADGK